MKQMPKNYLSLLNNIVVWILLASTLFFLLRGLLLVRSEQYPVQELDSGWTIERNGVLQQEDTLTAYKTGNVARDETFVLTRTLEQAPGIPSVSLFFRNIHCAVTIRLDDKVIYTDGTDDYVVHKMVGRRLCFVPLPANYAGAVMTVELVAVEDNSIYGIGPFLFGLEQDLFTKFLKDRHYSFYIALFLCIFGIIQLLWLPFLVSVDTTYLKLLFSALTTLFFGIYVLGYYNLFELFTDIPDLNTMLEYTAFYMVPCAICGYIASSTEGTWRLTYASFVVFDILFVLLALTLHFMNAVHYTRFLMVSYVIAFFETTPCFALLVRGWRRRRTTYYDRMENIADRLVVSGFFCFFLGVIIDATFFMSTRFGGGQEAAVMIPFSTGGGLIYSFFLCVHYFLHGVMALRTEATRQKLQEKAYSDSLTGLSNRGECEMVLSRLGNEYRRFSIISFDLDGLKQVNDTFGHAEGDRMLRSFSALLQETFTDATLTGRMGGDEFIVILTGETCDKAETLLRELSEKTDAFNRNETVFRLAYSYGIAGNNDRRIGRRSHDIYMLADARMYDMKRRHKR